jgi:outer membrane lipoprotein-sorting protein
MMRGKWTVVIVAAVAMLVVPMAQAKKKPAKGAANLQTVAAAQAPAAQAAKPSQQAGLESVLTKMDETAAAFKTVETEFVWDQYQKVVDEMDTQKGVMYFRRNGQNIEMSADISVPDKKYVLFTDGTVQVYQPKADQITKYNAGKNKADFESFLVLGFGGRGHDLQKSFDVKYAGMETVGGVNAAKLELTPKAQKVKNMFQLITLWIDPARGISVQQKFDQSGDYRLAKYTNIKLNQKLPENVFKLKTTGKTTIVTPNG